MSCIRPTAGLSESARIIRTIAPGLAALVCGSLLASCTSSRSDSVVPLAPNSYADSFERAKQVLRDANFDLERVDAHAGVITTQPKDTAGLATPWDRDQSSLRAETDDLLSDHARLVRIWFEPVNQREQNANTPTPAPLLPATAPMPVEPGAPSAPGTSPTDIRNFQGELAARVDVVLLSTQRPGTRLDPTSIRMRSVQYDPALARQGMYPTYNVPIGRDTQLERRIAAQLESALKAAQRAPKDTPEHR